MHKDIKFTYGFWEGGAIYELGSKNDMQSFFDIIEKYCDIDGKELVTKELKTRYIKYEDVYELDRVFKEIEQCFSKLKIDDLKELERYKKDSYLDWNQTTVKEVFWKFIKSGLKASEGLIWAINNLSKERLNFFSTMKVTVTNIPYTDWILELPQEVFDNFKYSDASRLSSVNFLNTSFTVV